MKAIAITHLLKKRKNLPFRRKDVEHGVEKLVILSLQKLQSPFFFVGLFDCVKFGRISHNLHP